MDFGNVYLKLQAKEDLPVETIGDRIKAKRKEMGLTQLELADKLSVTDRAVSKWEQNEGNPDISILPRIASIFRMSLDYLMTGAEPEKEIVVMSKTELCAKNDDPTMIVDFDPNLKKDENGRTLLDYAKQYNSKKVLNALIDKAGCNMAILFGVDTRVPYSIPNIMLTCIPINREREVLKEIFHGDIREKDGDFFSALNKTDQNSKDLVSGFKKVFDLLIANYDVMPQEQRTYYFDMKEYEGTDMDTHCWFNAYPYFIESAVKQDRKDLAGILVDQVEAHNRWVDQSLMKLHEKHLRRDEFNYQMQHFRGRKLYLLPSTVDCLLSKTDYEIAYRINDLLENPRPKREIELLEVENDSNMTSNDKTEFRCVDRRMLVPSEIKKLRDPELAEAIINDNYVNYYEMVYKLLGKNKRELFEFFVDNGYDKLADLLLRGKTAELLLKSWNTFNVEASDEIIVRQPCCVSSHVVKGSDCYANFHRFAKMGILNDGEKIRLEGNNLIHVFETYKSELLNEVKRSVEEEKELEKKKAERTKAVKGLTRDYFEKLLEEEDEEMFIIKLCSLFDAILKYDYECDGEDLFERMRDFFDRGPKSRQCDDGWGYFAPDTEYEERFVKPWEKKRSLMQMLRIKRNSIVHPEEGGEAKLDHNDLEKCLEFVFQANGGHIFDE